MLSPVGGGGVPPVAVGVEGEISAGGCSLPIKCDRSVGALSDAPGIEAEGNAELGGGVVEAEDTFSAGLVVGQVGAGVLGRSAG